MGVVTRILIMTMELVGHGGDQAKKWCSVNIRMQERNKQVSLCDVWSGLLS